MHKVIFSIIVLFCCFSLSAQEIKVKSMELLQSDLSARTNPRLDGNDEPCALIKVIVPAVAGMQFEGWVIGNVGYRPGEYQVYVPAGTKKITFRHPDYAPGEIRFTIPIEGKCTYRVVLETPKKVGGLESVEKGDATAMLKQAKNYEQGTGSYSRNIEQAQEWYEKAAEAGSIEAQGYLAEVLYKGTKGFTRHQEKALKWNEVCAQRGNEKSIYRTAELYKELKKNEQAIAWYQKYNELHPDKDLQMQIAQLHSENHPERNKWLKIAANNGHIEAAYELASRLAPSDIQTASIYYQKAVDGNHLRAMYDYGTCLITGKYGIEKDETKGKSLLLAAKENGSLEAQSFDLMTGDVQMASYVIQIPELLHMVKYGDLDSMLKLILIYNVLGEDELRDRMKFVTLYNLSFDIPILGEAFDNYLISKSPTITNTVLVERYESKQRQVRKQSKITPRYTYSEWETYKSPIKCACKSNLESMIEYLACTSYNERKYDFKQLLSVLKEVCKNNRQHFDWVLNRIGQEQANKAPDIPVFYSNMAKIYHDKDVMYDIESQARLYSTDSSIKQEYHLKYWLQNHWNVSIPITTQYEYRLLTSFIEHREKYQQGSWKKEIKWLRRWLDESKITPEERAIEFQPWIRQLKESCLLLNEKAVAEGSIIIKKKKEERQAISTLKENAIKDQENADIRVRAKKMRLTTLEANGVAFNIVFQKKTYNFSSHDFHVMEAPVTRALWNAVMGKKVCSEDYNIYKSANYLNWLQKKKYYGNIWEHAKYSLKEEDIEPSDLDRFIDRLNTLTNKKFRIINFEETKLITSNKIKGVILLSDKEDYTIGRWDGKSRVLRLVY